MRLPDDPARRRLGIRRSRTRNWLIALPVAAALIAAYLVTAQQPPKQPQFLISVSADRVRCTISPQVFGSNVLWYGGENVLADRMRPEQGVRPDVIGLVSAIRPGVLRFPGGLCSETYHWRNGVGPLNQRKMIEIGGWYPHFPYFGTDEFADFCDDVGCAEKLITANYCTGSPQEAANWVEYCNISAPARPDPKWRVDSYSGTAKAPRGYFAWLRSRFGHPQPFNVRYWEIGNEVYCRTDVAPRLTAETYAADVVKFAAAMKAVDPRILVGAVSIDVYSLQDWNARVLKIAAAKLDFMGPHQGATLGTLTFDTYYSQVTTSRRVYFPASEVYTFSATMRADIMTEGQPASEVGVPAKMRFSIDGVPVCVWDVVKVAKHAYTCPVTKGYHRLDLAFINDFCNALYQGRDIYLYGLTRRSRSVPEENLWYPDDAEQQLLFNDGVIVTQKIRKLRALIAKYSSGRRISALITEGTLAYNEGEVSRGYPKQEVRHGLRMKAALWQAGFLNALIREQVPMYCHWLLFDGCHHGIIREPTWTADGQPIATPAYYTFQLYSMLGNRSLVETRVTSPTYVWPDGITPPPVFDGRYNASYSCPKPDHVPYLDVIAARRQDGKYLYIAVTNRSKVQATTRIQVSAFRCGSTADVGTLAVWRLVPRPDRIVGNRCAELEAFCDTTTGGLVFEPDDVGIRWSRIKNASSDFTYTFKPWSVTMIVLRKR